MTQPNLLELAKQGEPEAIATLINLTLEPKGVVAKAAIEDDCLYVFLSSARVLNAKTLVAFIQRGILRLEVPSIQQVQVYGQRFEDDQPLWVETFAIGGSPIAEALEALSHTSSSSPPIAYPSVVDADNSPSSLATPGTGWKQQWAERTLPLQASLGQALSTSKQFFARRRDRVAPPRDHTRREPFESSLDSQPVNYVKLSVLVTLAAFVTGGAVALIANSNTVGGDRKTSEKAPTIASGSQLTIKSGGEQLKDQQQSTARKYLETMNKAQQKFYRENSRFASTLEELERFAAVPFTSRSDYVYKLTVPSKTQSQLTAVPKADGLKSYTAAVSIAKLSNQAVAAICASQEAAKVPPLVFQSPEGTVQCPVEAAKAS
ncbi:type IV pilin-like G/H family protein [Stenomitos frigidus]|uniref:Uncharacterized protein n=1 Tax=Stenomitos frigidus ULC18 TaxID=2107698 RepID=A0A2T1E193_9CYAN|nr:type IV pilin-like G/H family protein [Stenomitos frigidus]PSB26533.1 hypothetical protein C7B82_19475 [Stenomitos frigidus ULC18]